MENMNHAGTPRIKQAQSVADILNAAKQGPQTLTELQNITGMSREAVRGWAAALADVGILKQGKKRGPGGSAATWEWPA